MKPCYRAGMEPSTAGTIFGIAVLAVAFCGGVAVVVWLAWSTVKGWRFLRSGPTEPLAWLRAMVPDHEALPSPTLRAPLWHGPGPSKPTRFLICSAQLAFIAALTYGMSVPPEGNPAPINPSQVVVSFWVAVLMAAFFTALITRLWDRAGFEVEGIAVFSTPSTPTAGAKHDEPVQERDRLGSRLGAGEVRKPPSSLWRGQQRG